MTLASCVALGPMLVQNGRPHERVSADLGFAFDSSDRRWLASSKAIRVINSGQALGTGVLSLRIIGSAGAAAAQAADAGSIPAFRFDGRQRLVVSLEGRGAFQATLDSLRAAETPFAMVATIEPEGAHAETDDKSATMEGIAALRRKDMKTRNPALIDPPVTEGVSAKIQHTREAPRAREKEYEVALRSGAKAIPIELVNDNVAQGEAVAIGIALTAGVGGRNVGQLERLTVFDTVAPFTGSYRGVVFADGRIVIQIRAGDRHSGLSEGSVWTVYSLDGGLSWKRKGHSTFENDLGKATLFETVLGPFRPGAVVHLGIVVTDVVGNATWTLPKDASVLRAPDGIERAWDLFSGLSDEGHAIFSPSRLQRMVDQVNSSPRFLSDPFESRRIRELSALPESLRAWGVEISKYRRVNAPMVQARIGERSFYALRLTLEK